MFKKLSTVSLGMFHTNINSIDRPKSLERNYELPQVISLFPQNRAGKLEGKVELFQYSNAVPFPN
jgi:hypothetical protein